MGINLNYLVTGAAGFIGFSVSKALLDLGYEVVGIDNHNSYYNPRLKEARAAILQKSSAYRHVRLDISDSQSLDGFFSEVRPRVLIHLAAQAGVRYSMENPMEYVKSNLIGFQNVIDNAIKHSVEHFVYASSSSVYGANTRTPFSEDDSADHPLSLYAATKRSNELVAHSYSNLYQLPSTGLRFFTVYGPWGRPDMALFKFTESIIRGEPITLFNNGIHKRDFTYIDDVVKGILTATQTPPTKDMTWNSDSPSLSSSAAPWRIYNLGHGKPVELATYIEALEASLKKKANVIFAPLQPGDVPNTHADTTKVERDLHFRACVPVEQGVGAFVDWYQNTYVKFAK
jgi:UDP-glucuronate 4-epimerase